MRKITSFIAALILMLCAASLIAASAEQPELNEPDII